MFLTISSKVLGTPLFNRDVLLADLLAVAHLAVDEAEARSVDLNLAVFPVKYNDKFYTDIAASPTQDYTQLGALPFRGGAPLLASTRCPALQSTPLPCAVLPISHRRADDASRPLQHTSRIPSSGPSAAA